MLTKNVLSDVDGVLLNWFGAFKMFVDSLGYEHAEEDPADWSLDEWFCDKTDIRYLIDVFNSSPAFGKLYPIPMALLGLSALSVKECTVHAITCCSDHELVFARRAVNLSKLFPGHIKSLTCLPMASSKLDYFKKKFNELGKCWVIDDRLKYIEEADRAGHKGIWLNSRTTHSNARKAGLPDSAELARNWADIMEIIVNVQTGG